MGVQGWCRYLELSASGARHLQVQAIKVRDLRLIVLRLEAL